VAGLANLAVSVWRHGIRVGHARAGASGDRYGCSEIHRHLGFYHLLEDIRPKEAVRQFGHSLELRERIGDPRLFPSALVVLGDAELAAGNPERSRRAAEPHRRRGPRGFPAPAARAGRRGHPAQGGGGRTRRSLTFARAVTGSGRHLIWNPLIPSGGSAWTRTPCTTAEPGPWRDHSTSRPTSPSDPSKTASTLPSGRFRTQPFTPCRSAIRRQVSRKNTPCTRPEISTR